MIGEKFNFEDVFFRDLTVCVLDTIEGQIKWTNRFTSGDVFVQVPIYYSLTGDERFLLDSFSDDIVSENRFIELNTDLIPRGHLTMTSFNIKSDEFANPNVWLRMIVENEFEIRKVLSKVRAVPITVNYDLEITLSSEIDTFKCSQAILDTLWIYKFMYFEHNFMNIDAVLVMPDSNSIEMSREKNLTSDNNIKLKCSFTVETYYPAFRRDIISGEGYQREYGSGMKDENGFVLTGGVSEYFNGVSNSDRAGNVIAVDTTGNVLSLDSAGNVIAVDSTGNVLSLDPTGNAKVNNTGKIINTGTINIGDSVGVTPNTTVRAASNPGATIDKNAPWVDGPFNPKNPLPAHGQTGSFYNTDSNTNPSERYGTPEKNDGYSMLPKRSRWFNNILRARERASTNTNDSVTGQQNVTPRPPNQ